MSCQKLLVVFAALMLGLACSATAIPSNVHSSCTPPKILGMHWMFIAGVPQIEAAVNVHGQAGDIGDYNGHYAQFDDSPDIQVALMNPVEIWDDGYDKTLTFELSTPCGSDTVSIPLLAPQAGYWGDQHYFDCADYVIIDNRGSGEPKGSVSPPGALFASKFRLLHKGARLDLLRNPYKAVGGKLTLLLAQAKIPGSSYYRSVVEGKNWLENKLLELEDKCPMTLVFITGYSQGAQVAGDVADRQWENLSGAVLFGDPYFNPSNEVALGGFSSIYSGALGRRPDTPLREGTFLSYCHLHDPVCQGLTWAAHYKFSAHTTYADHGEPQDAAQRLTDIWG